MSLSHLAASLIASTGILSALILRNTEHTSVRVETIEVELPPLFGPAEFAGIPVFDCEGCDPKVVVAFCVLAVVTTLVAEHSRSPLLLKLQLSGFLREQTQKVLTPEICRDGSRTYCCSAPR